MKKYLINGALALIIGFTYTSCKNNDVDYVPIAQQKTQAYAEAFKEMIGGEVDPNQNWGFETITISEEELAAARAAVRAGSRGSEPDGTKWPDYGYPEKPGNLKTTTPSGKSEEQIVTEWFQTHTKADGVTKDWKNYWVQQVHYKSGTYTVQQHEWETLRDGKEVWKTNTEQVAPLGHMDQIYANKDPQGNSSDHIYNFNTGTGSFMLVINSETKYGFGYEESWGTDEKHVWYNSFMAHIVDEANGIDGYYVGFDYQTYKGKDRVIEYEINGVKKAVTTNDWALKPDGVYDDRIIKIVPADKEPDITNIGGGETTDTETITNAKFERKKLMLQGRVFCEDLAKATRADIDFNDIVFDARIWKVSEFTKTNGVDNNDDNFLRYEAEICLLAAGGTIPANVASQDVHDLFGVGLTTMVNTVDGNSKVKITWDNSSTTKPVKHFTFNMTELITNNNGDISLDLIPIEVMWTTSDTNDAGIGQMKSVGHLGANVGDVPYKFCAPIGTPWASERNSIVEVYSGFADWAKGGSEPNWGNGTNLRYNNCPNGLSTDSKYVIDYTEEKQISSTSKTTTEIETVLWQGSRAMEYSASGNNGKYAMIFNSKDIQVGDKLRIYGTKSTGNATLVLKNNENGWQDIVSIDLSDLNNYKQIDVTEGMVNAMTSTTVNSWGCGCSITKITRWRRSETTTTN